MCPGQRACSSFEFRQDVCRRVDVDTATCCSRNLIRFPHGKEGTTATVVCDPSVVQERPAGEPPTHPRVMSSLCLIFQVSCTDD